MGQMETRPKTDEDWLAETADSPHLTKVKLSILGQIALERVHQGFALEPVEKPEIKH